MKTRTIKDVVKEITEILDYEGMTCVGFLVNCRTKHAHVQLKWGDTRPRIPRRKR